MKTLGLMIAIAIGGQVVFGGRIANPLPVLSSVSPKTVSTGASGQLVTLNGHSFVSSSTVMFNGVQHATIYVNSNRLAIQLGQADLYEPGTIPIVVVNPPPGGGNSSTAHILIEAPGRSSRAAER